MINQSSLYYICGFLYTKRVAFLCKEIREKGTIRPRVFVNFFSETNYALKLIQYYYGGTIKNKRLKINESDAPRFLRDISTCSAYSSYYQELANLIDYKAIQTSVTRQNYHIQAIERLKGATSREEVQTNSIPQEHIQDFISGFLDGELLARVSETNKIKGELFIRNRDDFIKTLLKSKGITFSIAKDSNMIDAIFKIEKFTRASKYGLAVLYEKLSSILYSENNVGSDHLFNYLDKDPKKCTRCHRFYPSEYFHTDYECKPCVRDRNNEKYQRYKKEPYERVFKTPIHKNGFRRMCDSLRCRVKKYNGSGKWWREALGLTNLQDFKNYVETQFSSEMGWHNYGSFWCLDHIKPCAVFILDTKPAFMECFHYTNLRPLTSKENFDKLDSYCGSSVRNLKNEIRAANRPSRTKLIS